MKQSLDPVQRPPKPPAKGLSILGYDNVKNTPINPRVRQELEYIDREVHHQTILFEFHLLIFHYLGSSSYHCSSIRHH
jgi:hypothetical protein